MSSYQSNTTMGSAQQEGSRPVASGTYAADPLSQQGVENGQGRDEYQKGERQMDTRGPEEEEDIIRQQQGGLPGVQEGDIVVEKPAAVREEVHEKNVHVVQPVVHRQQEVEHVQHHTVESRENLGKEVVEEEGQRGLTHGSTAPPTGGPMGREAASVGPTTEEHHEKKTMGEKIKDVFKGGRHKEKGQHP